MIYFQKKKHLFSFKQLIYFIVLLSITFLISCDEITKNSEKKYVELSSKTYTTPEDAYPKLYSFLNEYSPKNQYYDDVNKILNEFKNMSSFFEKKYEYNEFLSNAEKVHFSDSPYPTVANTWNYIYKKRKKEYLDNMMKQITKSSFNEELKSYAFSVCREQCSINKLQIAGFEETKKGDLINLDGLYGKKCSSTFTFYLEGGLFNLKKKTIRIQVEGTISINKSGNYSFSRTNHYIEKITD